jgi:hypothetical protein
LPIPRITRGGGGALPRRCRAQTGSRHAYYVVTVGTPILVHNYGGSIEGHSTKCNCADGNSPKIPRNPAGRRENAATQPCQRKRYSVPTENEGSPTLASDWGMDPPSISIL